MTIWDKIYNAGVIIISIILMNTVVFFFTLPIRVQFYVPFSLLFLVYDVTLVVWLWLGLINPRSFKTRDRYYRISNSNWFYVIIFSIIVTICVLYWDMAWPMIYSFLRHVIPYWEKMVDL